MKNPKISVIMSVYNGMPYLEEATKSILNQTYKNFEFIVIDDASTDNTWNYLKSLKDKRIKLIKNKKNYGLVHSLNKAIKLAKGEYIARMDADDISLPARLHKQLSFLNHHPKVDICGAWVDLIDGKDKIVGQKKYPIHDNEIKRALSWYPPIIHPTLICRKRVLQELGGYNPQFDMAEDYELLMRAIKKYKMANIPQKLLQLRLWDKRRSRVEMSKMDQVDLKIKVEAFKKGYFGSFYFLIVAKKFLMTYFLPLSLKIKLAKILRLA